VQAENSVSGIDRGTEKKRPLVDYKTLNDKSLQVFLDVYSSFSLPL